MCIALAAFIFAPMIGVSSTLLALLCGIALSFAMTNASSFIAGIGFSSSTILRIGIALLGLSVSFADFSALGWTGLCVIGFAIAGVIGLGFYCAPHLKLPRAFGALTGGAVAICGASAAMAIGSILPDYKDKDRDISLTVIIITALSTLGMILYPMTAHVLGLNVEQTAFFLGGTIHDIAQSAGAGYSVSDEVGALSVLTKMVRVAYIVPVLFALMIVFQTCAAQGGENFRYFKLPLFLVVFFALMLINSAINVPDVITAYAGALSKAALLVAMVAIGIKTDFKALIGVGWTRVIFIVAQALLLVIIMLAYVTY